LKLPIMSKTCIVENSSKLKTFSMKMLQYKDRKSIPKQWLPSLVS
jgi:hypothetical protein